MKAMFLIGSCDSCRKVINDFKIKESDFVFRDMKKEPLKASELDYIQNITGSYEVLLNRRAKKYKSQGLKDKESSFTEQDYREIILSEYTFLRRPIFVDGNIVAIGTSSKAMNLVAAMVAK